MPGWLGTNTYCPHQKLFNSPDYKSLGYTKRLEVSSPLGRSVIYSTPLLFPDMHQCHVTYPQPFWTLKVPDATWPHMSDVSPYEANPLMWSNFLHGTYCSIWIHKVVIRGSANNERTRTKKCMGLELMWRSPNDSWVLTSVQPCYGRRGVWG